MIKHIVSLDLENKKEDDSPAHRRYNRIQRGRLAYEKYVKVGVGKVTRKVCGGIANHCFFYVFVLYDCFVFRNILRNSCICGDHSVQGQLSKASHHEADSGSYWDTARDIRLSQQSIYNTLHWLCCNNLTLLWLLKYTEILNTCLQTLSMRGML